MKTFIITEQQAQTIANYLIKKPFEEVVGLIQILQTLQVYEPDVKSELKKEG